MADRQALEALKKESMRVYYQRAVEGRTTPAFIHNGGYYYIDMPVYEDGTVSCWKEAPLADISRIIQSGWLTPSVPNGEMLTVHGLSAFRVQNARWNHTVNDFFEYLLTLVKSMNSEMQGIYAESDEKKKRWEKYRVEWSARGTPFSLSGDDGYIRQDGKATHIFTAFDGIVRLDNITAFANGTYAIDHLGMITEDELKSQMMQNLIFTSPPLNVPIHLGTLGIVEASEISWEVSAGEKWKEIFDYKNELNNKPTASAAAVSAYHAYLEHPTDKSKETLRAAYEAVPEHERMYLGDMDSKDWDYQRILYSNGKRQV
ncbi:MAG: hypothetical protein LBL04_06015 [Bacteroidales bacterium]|nr:hypothetical protein [Bacteroidales bacterium]